MPQAYTLQIPPSQVHLRMAYKNFAASQSISHIGLGVSALNTGKVLRRKGIDAQVWPIANSAELEARMAKELNNASAATHILVSAPWIPLADMMRLTTRYPHIMFGVNCHSNVGFLMADQSAVHLLRGYVDLETGSHNFRVSGNNKRFCSWVSGCYSTPCQWMPNLYYLPPTEPQGRPLWAGCGALRIGSFGAVRPLKNFISAAAAALQMATHLKAELQFYMNSGRTEGGGNGGYQSIVQMFAGVPNAKLYQVPWTTWPEFRNIVRSMYLLIQPSYTESFSMVVADGVATGIPSVVSSAVEWAPKDWMADADSVGDIVKRGLFLLRDSSAGHEGWSALAQYIERGTQAWEDYLLNVW